MQKEELINTESSLNLGDERKMCLYTIITVNAYQLFVFLYILHKKEEDKVILLLKKIGRNGGQQMKFDTSCTAERKIFRYERNIHCCLVNLK